MNKFGDRLKELRLEKGLTQKQLAEEVNLPSSAIGFWELGKRSPSLDAVIQLAKYFGVSLDYLAGLED